MVTSWSFVVVTQNRERREKALLLLEQLFATNFQGEWSRYAQRVPTQLDAFAYWDTSDPYTSFLQDTLLDSVAPPDFYMLSEIGRAMQQAQRGLLTGEQSPELLMSNPIWLP